jgi:O-antigen/teichoic acid export membrane protein
MPFFEAPVVEKPPFVGGAQTGGDQASGAQTVMVLASAEVAGKLASFVLFAVAARSLGPKDFGTFNWAFSLSMLAAAFVVWGFDVTVIQLGSPNRQRIPELLTNVLAWRLLLGSAAIAVLLSLPLAAASSTEVLAVMALACMLDTVNDGVRSAAGAMQRQRGVAINLVLQRIATAGLAITVLLLGWGVLAMAVAYCLGTIVGVLLMLRSTIKLGIRPSPRLVSIPVMISLWRGSAAAGLTNMINMLNFRLDVVLLGILTTANAVGYYSSAYKLFETVLFVAWSLYRVAVPAMAAAKKPTEIGGQLNSVLVVAITIYIPYILVMALRSGQVLDLFFGSGYGANAGPILIILMAALIPYSVQYLLTGGLLSQRRNLVVTIVASVSLAVNVVANLILIPQLGAKGAALATFLAMVVQGAVLWFIATKMTGSLGTWRGLAGPIFAGITMIPVLHSNLALIPATILAGVFYFAVWLLVASRFDPKSVRQVAAIIPGRR